MLAALAFVAIVTQDQAPLRAAPRESAPQQAVLWQGDSLEIRGERLGYLQVYDHRRERGGYIRASQVRTQSLRAENAPELLSVVRFLRDTPGAEALGISYAAAYLKAAPAEAIGAEPFDALGAMADRLARRASTPRRKGGDAALSAHLEVAAAYGVTLRGFEQDGQVRLCYDGEAFRRVMALPASDDQRARAALALTRDECVDPALAPVQRIALDEWRADILDRVRMENLPEFTKNRIRLRRAGVWASRAYQQARRGQPAQEAANRAIQELAAVNRNELAEEDGPSYAAAAIRVGASRWAAEPAPSSGRGLSVVTTPGQPGETCVHLVDGRHDQKAPLFTRCTYGVVWTASARADGRGNALALAVQPLEAWRELWVFRRSAEGWGVEVLPPSTSGPDIGYLEFAGWVPGGARMLAAREVRVDGQYRRSFELLRTDTLAVEKKASRPDLLSLFRRWQDPLWKAQTVSLR